MPVRFTQNIASARLEPYRRRWLVQGGGTPSDAAIAAMYAWQTSLAGAWFEVIGHIEVLTRNAIDNSLRDWNLTKGFGPDWIQTPHPDLARIIGPRALHDIERQANSAQRQRTQGHPRFGAPLSHDDYVAQLTFGNLTAILPIRPPNRARLGSGYSPREHLWRNGLRNAFPGLYDVWQNKRWARVGYAPVPGDLIPAYALASAFNGCVASGTEWATTNRHSWSDTPTVTRTP
ncbi:hypothetical protein [Gordonia phthalatica]|uniref:hypothetical protein n=1 Tax=Gordonia phthalatica TaxID=1136941 RepID=UPI0012FEBAE8|nr:hypothetical protein [Gordonia phthalatica]